MKRLFLFAANVLIAASLLDLLGGVHVSAMKASSMDHASMSPKSSSGNCITLCTSAVFTVDKRAQEQTERDEADASLPYWLQVTSSAAVPDNVKRLQNQTDWRPPPKVPLFIQYAVLRR